MDFSESELEKLSRLCRIELRSDEKMRLRENLSKILSYIEQLKALELEGVAPCNHVLPQLKNVLREDRAQETLSREEFLKNAPQHIGGMIRVPPVIRMEE
ncbi:MAG: glutamyl-tRNA amidotransferase [Chlamydiae bacterium RIFCSPLOWO2_12_FULL_49_12]|nr:MAG: glutamyl-tRNA amidotransferase [Chlamydiae bacterium RIFCSPLOWO2_02_FULL_49_12]OGN71849.1 MAG: glutamyl-tRNA amidotransferase [Chlamydiae bacterium RIFCSPLOWO2_12_FULL_49_12]